MKKKIISRIQVQEEQSNWLLSYADIVTILLCFFMLYFNIDKRKQKNETQEYINSLTSDVSLKNLKSGETYLDKAVDNDLKKVMFEINDSPSMDVFKHQRYFHLEFPDGDFFSSGEAKLRTEKILEVQSLAEKLKPQHSKFQVTIIGYTDPKPVTQHSGRWWKSNEELSAARALSVLNVFQKAGFKAGSVYIGGQGIKTLNDKPRGFESGKTINQSELKNYRTFSLKIEPIQ